MICDKKGATVGCCARGCHQNFHLLCARQAGSVFQRDKQVFCRLHSSHRSGEVCYKSLGNKYCKSWKFSLVEFDLANFTGITFTDGNFLINF